jgi:hypothetical protein
MSTNTINQLIRKYIPSARDSVRMCQTVNGCTYVYFTRRPADDVVDVLIQLMGDVRIRIDEEVA